MSLTYARESALSERESAQRPIRVLVYSDDRNTRDAVRFGIGKRPDRDLPEIEYVECATHQAAIKLFDAGDLDVAILDGEAVPSGGMGLARQVKDEIYRCPPVLVLIGRPQDAWLATWSRADAVLSHPIDPVALCRAALGLIRRRLGVAVMSSPGTT